jgi:hypothetical protein
MSQQRQLWCVKWRVKTYEPVENSDWCFICFFFQIKAHLFIIILCFKLRLFTQKTSKQSVVQSSEKHSNLNELFHPRHTTHHQLSHLAWLWHSFPVCPVSAVIKVEAHHIFSFSPFLRIQFLGETRFFWKPAFVLRMQLLLLPCRSVCADEFMFIQAFWWEYVRRTVQRIQECNILIFSRQANLRRLGVREREKAAEGAMA